jgi:hypothetical protein
MVSGLNFEASSGEIATFLIATDGFVAFMRTREIEERTAKVHSKNSEVFVGQCQVRASTIERMIADGLLSFVGCESMTVAGVLEYFEPTEKARIDFGPGPPH